jgi:MFS family permease
MHAFFDEDLLLLQESCDFYLSELKRNSSDLLLMGCSMEDINGRGRGLIFDSSVVTTSIVTSYNLTCQRKWIKDFIDVLFEVAVLFGCLAFGFVSDHLGRLKAILIGLCTASTCGIIGAFIKSNAAGFAFFHLCVGLGTSGLFSAAFLLMLEVSSKTLALSLFPAGTIVGALISGLMSYMVPVWSTLQLAAFVPGLVVAAFLAFFAAESPRWMIATGNCEKARSLVKTGAAVNSREIKLQTLHPDLGTKKGQKIDNIKGGGQKGQISSGEWMTTIRKVCNFEDKSTAFYRNWTLNLLFHWTVVGLCLNGQLIKASSSNPHANVSYEALSSLPGFLMALVLSRTWGCRPLLTFCHLLSAVMLIVQSLGLYFSEVEGLALFGHLTANISLCAALASLQLLTSVMASTATRGTLVGLCLAFFHIGTIAGYPLNLLAILAQWLPTTIMAFLAVVAAVTAHLFPETSGLHQPLPDKWDHIIDLNKVPRKSYLLCNCVCPQNLKEICTFT